MCKALWLQCVLTNTPLHRSHTVCSSIFKPDFWLCSYLPEVQTCWKAGKRLLLEKQMSSCSSVKNWGCGLEKVESADLDVWGRSQFGYSTGYDSTLHLTLPFLHKIQFPEKLEGSLFRERNYFECHGPLLSLSSPLILFSFLPSFHNLLNLFRLPWAKQVSVVTQHQPRCAGRSALLPGGWKWHLQLFDTV